MRLFLSVCLVLSAHGAAFPEKWLNLTDAQRWAGVAFIAGILAGYEIKRIIISKLNDK